jgi:hypothetical protein
LGVFREERRDFEEEIDGGEFLVGRQHHQRWLGPLLSSSLRLLARLLALDGRVARMLAGGELRYPRPEPRCPREPAVAPLHPDDGAPPPSQSLLPSSGSRKGEKGAGKKTRT